MKIRVAAAVAALAFAALTWTPVQAHAAVDEVMPGLYFGAPSGLLFDGDGDMLVCDAFEKQVWRVAEGEQPAAVAGRSGAADIFGEPAGGYDDDVYAQAAFMYPWDIAPFLDGYLVSDTENNALRYMAGDFVYTAAGAGKAAYKNGRGADAAFDRPTGLAADDKGNVYIADTGNNRIRVITPTGWVSTYAGGEAGYRDGGTGAARFREPTGLCWRNGALYVADSGNHVIRKIADGRVTTVAGAPYAEGDDGFFAGGYADGAAGSARFSSPQGVAATGDGTLYIADTGNGAVRMLSGGKVSTLAAPGSLGGDTSPVSPRGLALHGGALYVTDVFSGAVMRLAIDAGLPYTDVNPDGWYVSAIRFVTDNGLFMGVGDRLFAPNANMTRGMLVTVLGRYWGGETDGEAAFDDLDGGKYYAAAVRWAADSGILMGDGGLARADDNVTREDIAVMLYRYAGFAGADPQPGEGALAAFADAGEVSAYAADAMSWAVENGIIAGVSADRLDAKGLATRAQVAQMFMNMAAAGV